MVDGTLQAHTFDIAATVDVAVNGDPVGSLDLALGCVRGERSALRGTIPGAWLRQGTEVAVTLRSGAANVSVPTETVGVVPIVAAVPLLEVTVVPLVVGETFPDPSRSTYETWLDEASRRFAIDRYDLEIRAPLDLGLGDECSIEIRSMALHELRFLHTEEDSERFFVGVLPCRVGGIAFRPGFVQVTSPGVESTRTFMHELGHNFSLPHAPCGNPPGVDPNYPYAGGVLGLPGFDVATESWIPATDADLMGYCGGEWLSDYFYARSARYRLFEERPPVLDALDADASVSILVQGAVRPDGSVLVTHAVRKLELSRVRTTASSHQRATVVVEVLGREGEVLVRRTLDLDDVSDATSRVFSGRIGVHESIGLAATNVRVAYEGQHGTRSIVDGD